MSWQEAMLADFTRLVHARTGHTEEVKHFEIDTDSTENYGCHICNHGSLLSVSIIFYFMDENTNVIYSFYGDWTDLMNAINALETT